MQYSGKDIGVQVSYIARFVPFSCHWERSCYKTFKKNLHRKTVFSPFSSFGNEEKVAADPRVRPLAWE